MGGLPRPRFCSKLSTITIYFLLMTIIGVMKPHMDDIGDCQSNTIVLSNFRDFI